MSDSANETQNESETNNNCNNNNNNNTKKNAICLFIQTPQINKHFKSEHDQKYFKAMKMKNEYQDYMGYYVMFAIIPAIFKASDCKKYLLMKENQWFEKVMEHNKNRKKKQQIIDINDDCNQNWYAYHLKHVHELSSKKKNKGQQNFMKIDSSMLEQFKMENPLILQYQKEYDLIYKGLVIDSRMISLIKSGKKTLEYRTTHLSCIETIPAVDIHHHLGQPKKRKNEPILVTAAPRRINLERVPSRAAIKTKPKKHINLKSALTGIHKEKRYWLDWFVTDRIVWNPMSMTSEMQWVLYKSNDKKNDNKQICEHNNELLKCMSSTVKACKYWRDILNKKEYNWLLNIADVSTTAPIFMERMLQKIIDEIHRYPQMRAPIAYIFHLIRPSQCPKCNIECDYQFIANEFNITRGPEYLWVCGQCQWRRSVWTNTVLESFDKQIRIEGLLVLLFNYTADTQQKYDSFNIVLNDATVRTFRNFIKNIGYIYERRASLKVGGKDKYGKPTKTYSDHTHFNALKYNQGYKKNKKRCVLGSTDDAGLLRFDRVESERQIETDYYILRQLNDHSIAHTDKGNAFNNLENLFDDVKHNTVNHSGQLDPMTGRITYFKDWVTGHHTDNIEGVFGRFKMWVGAHPTMMQGNITKFEKEMANYTIRFNYGCNYPQQGFWNYITMMTIVTPVYGDWLTIVALEDFSDVYYVQDIIQKKMEGRIPKYMVKWKGYGHRENEWLTAEQFMQPWIVTEFEDMLKTKKGQKEIEKRIKRYHRAINRENKQASKKKFVAGLSISKIKKYCDNDNDTLVKGKNLFKKGHVWKRRLQKGKTRISGDVIATSITSLYYTCSAICKEKGHIKEWVCICHYGRTQRKYLCKHLVALLLDCCANKTK